MIAGSGGAQQPLPQQQHAVPQPRPSPRALMDRYSQFIVSSGDEGSDGDGGDEGYGGGEGVGYGTERFVRDAMRGGGGEGN